MLGVRKLKAEGIKFNFLPPQGLLESSVEKAPVSVACGGESPLDGICLSESDKTAVLTLIREEVKALVFCPLITPCLCEARAPAGRSHLCWACVFPAGSSDFLQLV